MHSAVTAMSAEVREMLRLEEARSTTTTST